MPLHEVLLSFDGRCEVRSTEELPAVGDVLQIHGSGWRVVGLAPGDRSDGQTRYLLQPLGSVGRTATT